jgi:crotonobetainyl-CoA:carnitine CoA-transferase CaiB-like acyl-CoA transferase
MVGGLLSCKDGYIVMAAMQDNQWAGLVDLMGTPEWTKEEKYVSEVSRAIHAREATAKVQAWMTDHTMEEVFREGQKRGVPIGAVYAPGDLAQARQLRARGFFAEITHPEVGTLPYPTAPYVYSRTPWSATRPAPLLGQHNDEVFTGLLGYTPEETAAVQRGDEREKGGDGRE